jgi:hypothetical protein
MPTVVKKMDKLCCQGFGLVELGLILSSAKTKKKSSFLYTQEISCKQDFSVKQKHFVQIYFLMPAGKVSAIFFCKILIDT